MQQLELISRSDDLKLTRKQLKYKSGIRPGKKNLMRLRLRTIGKNLVNFNIRTSISILNGFYLKIIDKVSSQDSMN